MLDNQTPAYHAKAIEIVNRRGWKKRNLHFRFFAGLGHALDPRDDYDDVRYRRAAPETMKLLAETLGEYAK